VPAGGSAGQVLAKVNGVDYNTEWVNQSGAVVWGDIGGSLSAQVDLSDALAAKYDASNPSGFITSAALTGYLSKAGNLAGLTSLSTARDNLNLGLANTPAFAGLDVLGSGTNASHLTPTSLSLIESGSGQFTIQPSQGIVFPDATIQTTAYPGPVGATAWGTITGTLSAQTDLQTALDAKLSTSTAASTYFPIPTGDTTQYIAGDGTLITFPTLATANKLTATVYNETGSTITKGSVVYIVGAHGNLPTIALSQANAESTSAGTYGLVSANIGNNSSGTIVIAGVIENLDTQALADGDKLYLSPTVAGGYTTTKPSAPYHMVYVGVVTRAHPTQGTIQLRIQNGFELDELHDVAAQTPSDNDLLAYELATSLWKNKSFTTLGLATQAWVDAQGYLQAGALTGYATESWVTANFLGSSALTGYATESWVTGQGYLTNTAALGYFAPLASASLTGNVTITTNSANPALVITQDGAGDIIQFKDVTSDTTYAFIDANGKVSTIASTTANAGFNVAHGAAPTTPTNGDVWTTTGGLFARINGGTRQFATLSDGFTYSGNNTFAGPTLVFGNTTAASTVNIATGATLTATTKAVNIGTNGVAGSTTNIAIGSTTGTSTTTLQGSTVGATLAADTNTTGLATTAFVVGQAGSATPVVNGTAAIGTSLRYARQDHVHPTDTSRAALAGATFTGKVNTLASSTTTAGLNVPHGAAPTTPTNGDLWTTTTGVYVRINGATQALSTATGAAWGSITGTLSSQTDLQTALNAKLDSTTAASTYYLQTNPAGYITSSALSGYLTSATAASTYQTIAGMSSYLTTSAAAAGYYPLTGNPSGFLTSAPVTSVAGRTGAVTLANTDISGLGTMATATAADYSTTIVANGLYYPLSSNPAGYLTSAPVTSVAGRTGAVTLAVADVSGAAPTASPSLSGVPLSTTAAALTNTTQIATTAFVRSDNNCKAWVNFNGTGTVAIRASYNVSSITDGGVGNYTVNFTTAISDANYSPEVTISDATGYVIANVSQSSLSTTTLQVFTGRPATSAQVDTALVSVSVFR
jgi:hypothetical protein